MTKPSARAVSFNLDRPFELRLRAEPAAKDGEPFHYQRGDILECAPGSRNGEVPGDVVVNLADHPGTIDAECQLLASPPALDIQRWSLIEEIGARFVNGTRMRVFENYDENDTATAIALVEELLSQVQGWCMVRASTRPGDTDGEPSSLRLQVWPTDRSHELRTVHRQQPISGPPISSPAELCRWAGEVDVSSHGFLITGLEIDPTQSYCQGRVFDAGNNLVFVHTGVAAGVVGVEVEWYDGDPVFESGEPYLDLAEWESVEQISVPADVEMHVVTLDGDVKEGIPRFRVPPGNARNFRVAVRGRAVNWDAIVDRPTEQFLIQTWPSLRPTAAVMSLKWTDGVWDIERD